MKTPTRLAALAVTCTAALSLTGATATAQTRAQTPAIGTLTAAAGCVHVIPVSQQIGAAEVAACLWGAAGAPRRDVAIIGTFDSTQGVQAWLAWNNYPAGQMVVGGGWAAVTNGPGATGILVSRLGGTVR